MSVAAWSLEWRWGGERGTVSPVDVAWTERVSMFSSEASIRRADVACVLPIDVPAMWDRIPPSQGVAVLRRGNRVVMSGGWRELRFGAPVNGRTPVELTIAEDETEDRGVWPPVTSWRTTAEDSSYRVWSTESGEIDQAALYEAADKARGNTLYAGPLDNIIVDTSRWIRHTDFSTLANMSDGQQFPWPFGVFGDTSPIRPGSPAWIVDTSGDGKLLISGVPVSCATVDIVGPKLAAADRVWKSSSVPVYHASINGRRYAYVKLSDVAADLETGNDGLDKSWFAVWPTAGQPGGAGTLLLSAYAAATVRADLGAFQALAPILDRYLMAGYIDATVTPTGWARDQLLSILPVSVVPGPLGIRPILWPWLDAQPDVNGRAIVDGLGVSTSDDMIGSLDSTTPSRVIFRYGARPDTRSSVGTVSAAPSTSAFGAATANGGDEEVGADSVWDRTTAEALAFARYRAMAWTPRVVPLYVNDARYDVGGDSELFVGDVVRFTSARFGWTNRPAVVGSVERDGNGNCRMELYLRDEPLQPNG